MHDCSVTFMPHHKSARVPQGTDVLSAALKCGIVLAAPCGGEGLCGKCRVVVTSGSVAADATHLVSAKDRKLGVVLACQATVQSDCQIRIPEVSLEHRATDRRHDTDEYAKGSPAVREDAFERLPLARKLYLELDPPTATDAEADLERLERALTRAHPGTAAGIKVANLKRLSALLRANDFKVTVALGDKDGAPEILALEGGDTTRECFGLAFDIGTTTIAAQLVDLATGTVLGTRIAFNRQSAYGGDIITRIIHAADASGRAALSAAVLSTMNDLIEDLAEYHAVGIGSLYATVCAGNVTMMHLLLGVDPAPIRRSPHVPTATAFPTIRAAEARIEANPRGLVSFVPGVAAYVGGDIVSGVLACGLADSNTVSLLVDIGTNGEIVLGNSEWMIGAAASAGPAFEGSGLACGMKAVGGAIQRVGVDKDLSVSYETIAAARPRGICGSGYIDLLCQLLRRGVIGKDGKIDRTRPHKRIRKAGATYEFVVAFKGETETGSDIVIQDDDIDNLKRSKGAIYSAIASLLVKVGIDIAGVSRIYIAGGFGNYLNIENAISIGMLPDTAREKYQFVGNASLAGARMALMSGPALARAHELCGKITYIDLSAESSYMDEYVAALFFPHTDAGRFPSVRL